MVFCCSFDSESPEIVIMNILRLVRTPTFFFAEGHRAAEQRDACPVRPVSADRSKHGMQTGMPSWPLRFVHRWARSAYVEKHKSNGKPISYRRTDSFAVWTLIGL